MALLVAKRPTPNTSPSDGRLSPEFRPQLSESPWYIHMPSSSRDRRRLHIVERFGRVPKFFNVCSAHKGRAEVGSAIALLPFRTQTTLRYGGESRPGPIGPPGLERMGAMSSAAEFEVLAGGQWAAWARSRYIAPSEYERIGSM